MTVYMYETTGTGPGPGSGKLKNVNATNESRKQTICLRSGSSIKLKVTVSREADLLVAFLVETLSSPEGQ